MASGRLDSIGGTTGYKSRQRTCEQSEYLAARLKIIVSVRLSNKCSTGPPTSIPPHTYAVDIITEREAGFVTCFQSDTVDISLVRY